METIRKHGNKLTTEEKETHISYDLIDKVWVMYSTIPKHFNKATRQGWTPVKQYIYDDDTVYGMVLTAPERSITIRNVEAKQMSEKQLTNLPSDDE